MSISSLLLCEKRSVSLGLFLVEFRIGSLLLGFSGDGSLDDIAGTKTFEFGVRALGLDFAAELFVAGFGGASGFNLRDVDIAVEDCLAGREGGFCLGAFGVPFCLLDGSLS